MIFDELPLYALSVNSLWYNGYEETSSGPTAWIPNQASITRAARQDKVGVKTKSYGCRGYCVTDRHHAPPGTSPGSGDISRGFCDKHRVAGGSSKAGASEERRGSFFPRITGLLGNLCPNNPIWLVRSKVCAASKAH